MSASPRLSLESEISPFRPMDPATGVRRVKLQPHEMTDPVTPTEDVFVVAHFGVPHVDTRQWSLAIDGLVGRPCTLSLDELRSHPKKIVEAVHQCCGSPLEPAVPTRRVANVSWGGVDLGTLLAEVGVDLRARFVWSYGLDGGEFRGAACDWFVKDLPIERLAAGGVMLAYELNGMPLPAEHGYPVRLVVPGYYGTNSVKWLWRMHLAEHRFEGLFTTNLYNDHAPAADIAAGFPARRAVWAIAPEAVIVTPAPDTKIRTGENVEIRGHAWSFRGIAAVEISVDGGQTYTQAVLEERRRAWAWQSYSFSWRPARRGETFLCVRALEAGGITQPREGARNAIHTVRIVVR